MIDKAYFWALITFKYLFNMNKLTIKNLIDKNVISIEQYRNLNKAFDFEASSWYAVPEDNASKEQVKDFEDTYLSVYQKIVDAILGETIKYDKKKVWASIFLQDYPSANLSLEEIQDKTMSQIKYEDEFLDSLNCIVHIRFIGLAHINQFFMQISRN